MSAVHYVIVAIAVFAAIGASIIVIGERQKRNKPTQRRGGAPGEGHHFMSSNYGSGRDSGSRAWRIPKNPNDYAKIFAPNKTERKK